MTDRAAVGRRKAKAKKKTQRIPPFAPSNRCADCINLTRRVAMLEDRMAVRDRINQARADTLRAAMRKERIFLEAYPDRAPAPATGTANTTAGIWTVLP